MKKKKRRSKRRSQNQKERPFDYCQYRDCTKESDIIVVIHGVHYGLCEKHYKLLDKVLDRLADKKGSASLEDLKIYVKNGRITKISF